METEKCPFEHPLIGEVFGCSHAELVSKRDGPHAICKVSAAALRCQRLFAAFKQAALPVFDVPDDLEKMPHSVPVKIQYGGLQGLAAQLTGNAEQISDIHALVDAAESMFGDIAKVPSEKYVGLMTAHQVKRRSNR